MKVIIPMAGYGTRLRPHTFSKPKPLINVAGKPVLGHVLDMLAGLAVEEYIFVTGYLGEQIEQYVGAQYPGLYASFFEQKELNGQSPAVHLGKERVDGPLLIVFVDTIIETDLSQLAHEPADAVAWVKRVADPRRFGVAELAADGSVRRLVEKPKSMDNNLAVVGFYYLKDGPRLMRAIERQMREGIQTANEYFLADAMQLLLADGLHMRVQEVEVWEDCGKPETVLHTNRYLLENGHDNSSVNTQPDVIGAGCTIESSIVRDSIVEEEAHIINANLFGSLVGRGARVSGRARRFNVGDYSEVGFE
jgi:glucose-1-phosphate thymidylyltransferase